MTSDVLAAPLAHDLCTDPPHAERGSARIGAVASLGLTVSDAERSALFYTEVLGFTRVACRDVHGARLERVYGLPAPVARIVTLRLGMVTVELTEFRSPRGRTAPADARSHDRWFQHIAIVVSDIYAAERHLAARGVRGISAAPQRIPDWNPAAAGVRAYYFRDPDGHPLELIQYPPGIGREEWQRRDALFLGIDHTAIVVRSTPASLAFYSALLGFRVTAESENHGIEQELLSGVGGARVRITSLAAPLGPGIELLEYLHPADGRTYPSTARVNDLIHCQTTLIASDVVTACESALRLRTPFVSKGLSRVPHAGGYRRGFICRDPDGHALQII